MGSLGAGGSTSTGGNTAASGGMVGTGGAVTATGGTSSPGTGGASSSGGSVGSGRNSTGGGIGAGAGGGVAGKGAAGGAGQTGQAGTSGGGGGSTATMIPDGGTGAASFHCVNWAVNGDNFQPDTLLLSGIFSTDTTYEMVKARATAVENAYTDLLKANAFRMPINEPTVNTASYWASYKAVIDVAVAKGMKVIIAFWAKDTGVGKPADINAWYTMWKTVIDAYVDSPTIYFDVHNEPHGYANAAWIQQVKDWMAKFPNVPKSRIIVAGTGWDDNVANVAGQFPDVLLEVHDYSFNGTNSQDAWGKELIGRLGSGVSRTIVGEWGTGVRNVDFSNVGSDNGKAFMAGFANAIHDNSMGSCWWPGLWAIPGNTSSWSLLTMNGTQSSISYSIQNQSALDQIWHSWKLQ